jgi:hypothetical protein
MDLIYKEINEYINFNKNNLYYLIDEFKEEYKDMQLPMGIAVAIDNYIQEEKEGKNINILINEIIGNIKVFLKNKEEEGRIATSSMYGGKRKKSKKSKRRSAGSLLHPLEKSRKSKKSSKSRKNKKNN